MRLEALEPDGTWQPLLTPRAFLARYNERFPRRPHRPAEDLA